MTGESIKALVIERLSIPAWQNRAAPLVARSPSPYDVNERQPFGRGIRKVACLERLQYLFWNGMAATRPAHQDVVAIPDHARRLLPHQSSA
jgi:hypothetical protein